MATWRESVWEVSIANISIKYRTFSLCRKCTRLLDQLIDCLVVSHLVRGEAVRVAEDGEDAALPEDVVDQLVEVGDVEPVDGLRDGHLVHGPGREVKGGRLSDPGSNRKHSDCGYILLKNNSTHRYSTFLVELLLLASSIWVGLTSRPTTLSKWGAKRGVACPVPQPTSRASERGPCRKLCYLHLQLVKLSVDD